jgi:GntR family histidine utilization transcriptional repressor
VLARRQGVGSFVAAPKAGLGLLEIQAIGQDVRARGHRYACTPHLLRREVPPPVIASLFDLNTPATVFHVVCVHLDDGVPIQLEDRWVNPALVPDFLALDFARETPTERLVRTVGASLGEHEVEAVRPDAETRRLLRIGPDMPCLSLLRTTWSGRRAVTRARLVHPGDRFRLRGRFKPSFG